MDSKLAENIIRIFYIFDNNTVSEAAERVNEIRNLEWKKVLLNIQPIRSQLKTLQYFSSLFSLIGFDDSFEIPIFIKQLYKVIIYSHM